VSSTDRHRSVLLHEVVEELAPQPDHVVLDATLGGAGHAKALAERLGTSGVFIGFDADADAIARAEKALADVHARTHFIRGNFRTLRSELASRGIEYLDRALFDLGWSVYQLEGGRGFSFQKDEPLAMTYEHPRGPGALTAEVIVNMWGEENIADVLYGWGDERFSRRIARAIVEAREGEPIKTTKQLADIVARAVPARYRRARIHPATKTFQALRIAVNDEMGALTEALEATVELLASGGTVAVIAFHSGEDRLVKRMFRQWEKEGKGTRSKKPITPTEAEVAQNPRARSAKMRIFRKYETES